MKEIVVREIDRKDKENLKRLVHIHMQTFSGFFLTFMGKGFLKNMYQSYCRHEASNLLGAFDQDGRLIGFLAYSQDMSGLYKYMIKHKLIPFAWYSLGAFIRKPKVFMRLIRAFLKPSEAAREERYIELSSIGVDPSVKSKGIGSRLIDALKQKEQTSGCGYINLETDAVDNDGANAFYVKNGFVLTRTYCTRENRKMNEYRYYWGQTE